MSPIGTTRRMRRICRTIVLGWAIAACADSAHAQPGIDAVRGAAKAAACDACHGTPERPPLAGAPSLAGQPEEFLVLQMILLRAKG